MQCERTGRSRWSTWIPVETQGEKNEMDGWRVRQMCRWSDHSWINSLLFGPATLIRTLTPCGLRRSNLGAGEPKGIHTGELHQQGGITLYQINGTIIRAQSCCIIKAWVCFLFKGVISGVTMESIIVNVHQTVTQNTNTGRFTTGDRIEILK